MLLVLSSDVSVSRATITIVHKKWFDEQSWKLDLSLKQRGGLVVQPLINLDLDLGRKSQYW